MEIYKVLQSGREILLKNGVEPREARFLLAFAMNITNEELLKYNQCSEEQYAKYMDFITRRANGEPYAYIVGYKEFMKLIFKVNENVLIPREDTEILVQEIIDRYLSKEDNKKIKILDMCTGSGCIAISLAKYIRNASVTAVDISEKALKIARENADLNDMKINFIKSDLFAELSDKYDIIVSNPPYIRKSVIDTLQKEVKSEPILALDGGESGLDFYKEITEKSVNYMNTSGILAFEIGFDQGEEVAEIMKNNNYEQIKIIKDFGGNDRVVIGILKND